MKISIVIPSFNQSKFIQATFDSIRCQNVDTEVIVIDGGSDDETIEVIKKNLDIISYFISEPDNGQADALRKGFEKATGDIFCWLNSDDKFKLGALATVIDKFKTKKVDVVHGDMELINAANDKIGIRIATPWLPNFLQAAIYIGGYGFYQPSTFWKKEIFHQVGGINASFQFCVDNDLFSRFIINDAKILHVNKFLSEFRVHANSKTCTLQVIANSERQKIVHLYARNLSLLRCLIVKNLARMLRIIFLLSTRRGHRYIWQALTSSLTTIP